MEDTPTDKSISVKNDFSNVQIDHMGWLHKIGHESIFREIKF